MLAEIVYANKKFPHHHEPIIHPFAGKRYLPIFYYDRAGYSKKNKLLAHPL